MNTTGVLVATAGLAILLVSALADPIGIGGDPGFGWKQMIGVGVGVVVAIGGAWLAMRPAQTP